MPSIEPEIAIEFKSISKAFGRVQANQNVTFKVLKGSIHAVVGENGAGKSTLMKMLFGLQKPDSGTIFINGKISDINTSAEARVLGIGMVHQHFMLAESISAIDHIILETSKLGSFQKVDRQQLKLELTALSESLGMPIPWEQKIEEIPIGIQQRLEILKLLYLKSQILILDEPTAVLTPQETEEFLKRLLQLKASGKTIILITHKLKEVMSVADYVTVLRRGQSIETRPIAEWSIDLLSQEMVGGVLRHSQFVARDDKYRNKTLLKVQNLLGNISFQIEAGEVLGIAGVEGNGQFEVIQALVNPQALEFTDGEGYLENKLLFNTKVRQSNRELRQSGIGYLSEDRLVKGVVGTASVLENFILGVQDIWSHHGIVQFDSARTKLQQAIHDYEIKCDSPDQDILSLSGGNQQKVLVARELCRNLKLLVAAQPTRGVDIGAVQKIHEVLLSLRKNGTGIVLISSELEELMKLSDRIVVLCQKRVSGIFNRPEFDEKKIGLAMGGGQTGGGGQNGESS